MKPIIIPDDADRAALSERIAGLLGRTLVETYPGREWMVKISLDASVATVFCVQVSLEYGYALHTNVPLEQLEAKARLGGGEILERFGLHRGRGDGEDAQGLIRDLRGNALGVKRGERA